MLIDVPEQGMSDDPTADDTGMALSPSQPPADDINPGRGNVVALVADLVFASKISGTAQAAGVHAECVRSLSKAAETLATAAALIVDLQLADDALTAIQTARSQRSALHILAFGAHVQKDLLAAAAAAGASEVMPRSQLSARLAEILVRLSRQTPA